MLLIYNSIVLGVGGTFLSGILKRETSARLTFRANSLPLTILAIAKDYFCPREPFKLAFVSHQLTV